MQQTPQTIFVQHPNPTPLNYGVTPGGMTIQQPTPPGAAAKFNGTAGATTGWIQVCCGIAGIVLAVAQLVLSSALSVVGTGIWAGVLFYIPTGILGIFSAKKNACVVVGYMVMCIISAMCACSMIITESVSAVISSYCYYGYFEDYEGDDCPVHVTNGRIAADSILAIIGLIEMVVAIVGSAYCCGGVCCGQSMTSTQFATTVVTQSGAPMVVTTDGAYIQPQPPMVQQTVAHPPAYTVHHAYPQHTGQPAHM